MHSAEEDNSNLIPHCESPINVFRNQLIIRTGKGISAYEEPHPNFHRHYISLREVNKDILLKVFREKLQPNILNGLRIPEEHIQLVQNLYVEHLSNYKIRITQRIVEDVTSEERKLQIIQEEHKRAHRNWRENKEQILEKFYFPKMAKLVKNYVQKCETCNSSKYDRHPNKPELQETPIPKYPSEIMHIDIIEIQREKFITCVDKFSKFAKFFSIKDKSVLHIREKIIKAIHYFTVPRMVVMDNETSFISPIVTDYLKTLGIEIYFTPSQRSEVNGAIERVHSTVLEIVRCLQDEYKDITIKELVNIAVDRYNNSIHSVTKYKPSDIFFGRTQRINYQNLVNFKEKVNEDLIGRIQRNQKNTLQKENVKRNNQRNIIQETSSMQQLSRSKGKQSQNLRKKSSQKIIKSRLQPNRGEEFIKHN